MADHASPTVACEQLSVPARLESPRSKLLYLVLAATGGARASELRSTLGMSSLTLYPVVRDLREAGLVERADDGLLRAVAVETTPPASTRGQM